MRHTPSRLEPTHPGAMPGTQEARARLGLALIALAVVSGLLAGGAEGASYCCKSASCPADVLSLESPFLAPASSRTHTCPAGSSGVPKDRCVEAAQLAGQRDGRPASQTALNTRSWAHMPPGCNIHARKFPGKSKGIQPYFNTNPMGKDYQRQFSLVCENVCSANATACTQEPGQMCKGCGCDEKTNTCIGAKASDTIKRRAGILCDLLPKIDFAGTEACTKSKPCPACKGDCDQDGDCAGRHQARVYALLGWCLRCHATLARACACIRRLAARNIGAEHWRPLSAFVALRRVRGLAGNLACFQRENGVKRPVVVPGCAKTEYSDKLMDFCYTRKRFTISTASNRFHRFRLLCSGACAMCYLGVLLCSAVRAAALFAAPTTTTSTTTTTTPKPFYFVGKGLCRTFGHRSDDTHEASIAASLDLWRNLAHVPMRALISCNSRSGPCGVARLYYRSGS